MKKEKTIKEILEKATQRRYYGSANYNLQRGFTKFLEMLEEKYKENFELVAASPKIALREKRTFTENTIEHETEKKVVGKYAGFILNNRYYYYQFDENPLFDDYIAAVDIVDEKIPDYFLDIPRLYNGCEIYTFKKEEKYFDEIAKEFMKQFTKWTTKSTKDITKDARKPREIERRFFYNV